MTNRIIYLDVIRIVAILLVVACHCFGDVSDVSPKLISLLTYIEMPCIGLFLAISGALVLPVKQSTGSFLKKRLKKIVIPTLFWFPTYLILGNNLTVNNLIGGGFHPVGSGILWFVYTIIGLYLVSPIISPWLERVSQNVLLIYLLIWAVTLCFPILDNWINTDRSYAGWTYYLSGYIGYYVLGFYLRKYDIKFTFAGLLYFVLLCIMIVAKTKFPEIELYSESWYLSIFGASGVVFYWSFLKYLTKKYIPCRLNNSIAAISNLVFGIYFIHIGLVKYITPEIYIGGFSYLSIYLIRVAITFFSALLISRLISLLPFSNYLIGFQNKKK